MNQGRRRGRYAPSPTGPLHLGNLRTALLAWLQIRLVDGLFILRMEDIDRPRVREGSAEQILRDLKWLGLDWDEGDDCGGPNPPYTQSQRLDYYREAIDDLWQSGHLYPCYCSRKDIAQATSAPHGSPPVYPGTCAGEVSESPSAPIRGGRRAAWRYRIPDETIRFDDRILGTQEQRLAECAGDYVLQRTDGLFAYQLVVALDDALMGITDVLRGEDLLDSSPRQIQLFDLWKIPRPEYWHVPLMRNEDGSRMAKRDQATSLQFYIEKGWSPEKVIGHLAHSLSFIDESKPLSVFELLQELTANSFRKKLQEMAMSCEQ